MSFEPRKTIHIPLEPLTFIFISKLKKALTELNIRYSEEGFIKIHSQSKNVLLDLIHSYLTHRFFTRVIKYSPTVPEIHLAFFRVLAKMDIDFDILNSPLRHNESTTLGSYLLGEFEEMIYLELTDMFTMISKRPNSDGVVIDLTDCMHEYAVRMVSPHNLAIDDYGDYRIRRYMELVRDGIIKE